VNAFTPDETMHRLIKEAMDSGVAATRADAEALFRGYRVCFVINAADAAQPANQIALLTGIMLASRVFLGGVMVIGPLDVPLRISAVQGAMLQDAVVAAGATLAADGADAWPAIFIGGEPQERRGGFNVRAVFGDWRGGVVPAHADFETGEGLVMPLSPMLAAALAVSEAFFHVGGKMPIAGRRAVGFSLWNPQSKAWLHCENAPPIQYLPSKLWLIGLGHLGQAYLWALGLLPYAEPREATLLLQDIDPITPSTWSTSILSAPDMAGIMKTRAMAAWSESIGFQTRIIERRFDASCIRQDDEPMIGLCGIDNALGRQALDRVGFSFVVEAGLGRGHRDFRTMRIHTLPGSRSAAEIWASSGEAEDVTGRAAYKAMLETGELDQCGVTLLAGKAVGAPFVGAIAACFVISEVLRLLHGGRLHHLIDLDLQSPDHRTVAPHATNFDGLNPGFVKADLTQFDPMTVRL
jgi:hypothetical protein